MAIEQMAMPQLGESVTEGTISKWLVSPGDQVNKYDPIAEVMVSVSSVSILQMISPTVRVWPSSPTSSVIVPVKEDGTSAFTLSVMTGHDG